ncbi:hypothetical protein HDU81_011357 [Chytriomyces hyalinus]|nr:hypothetical protein HDU81_011357 [Chytriomyces hyalinus]
MNTELGKVLASFPDPPTNTHAHFNASYPIPWSLLVPQGVKLAPNPLPKPIITQHHQQQSSNAANQSKPMTSSLRERAPSQRENAPSSQPVPPSVAAAGALRPMPLAEVQGLLKRAMEAPIDQSERQKLYRALCEMSAIDLRGVQAACHQQIISSNQPSAQISQVELDKYCLEFKSSMTTSVLTDTLSINAKNSAIQFRLVPEPANDAFTLEFSPTTGTIEPPLRSQQIQFKLTVNKPITIKTIVSVEVARGLRHFIVIRLAASREVHQVSSSPNLSEGRMRQPSNSSSNQQQIPQSPSKVLQPLGSVGPIPPQRRAPSPSKLPNQSNMAGPGLRSADISGQPQMTNSPLNPWGPVPPQRQPRQAQSQPVMRQNTGPGNNVPLLNTPPSPGRPLPNSVTNPAGTGRPLPNPMSNPGGVGRPMQNPMMSPGGVGRPLPNPMSSPVGVGRPIMNSGQRPPPLNSSTMGNNAPNPVRGGNNPLPSPGRSMGPNPSFNNNSAQQQHPGRSYSGNNLSGRPPGSGSNMTPGGPNPLQSIYNEITPDSIFAHMPPHQHVPKNLALLRAILSSTREGLACPGIFRERGNETEIKMIRDKVGKPGPGVRTRDTQAVATCIKMVFRDFPVLLCNEIPAQDLMEAKTPQAAYACVMRMHPQNRDLLEWVLDLIFATVKLESSNGMGLRALCTVWAPNLYGPPTPAAGSEPNQQDMMKFMSASIQMVTFLGLLVAKRSQELGV